ncbi:putative COP9 signalosome complex subunit 4 [Cardiosporidium cionae]|uniref:COP9 signalosome complex subunit 4 n=1 Tax=Cardiosporidium cionae TaxID=476202 RepID=A0ABQ7JBL9_9APIC|nr:putative COP9 signalosome complex subunit 4 [Cardiosporidium cionae]|eukprot:KAF8821392.1 putative COP9 signalosome complex subunit 4 [Cardiosporidium cionae]
MDKEDLLRDYLSDYFMAAGDYKEALQCFSKVNLNQPTSSFSSQEDAFKYIKLGGTVAQNFIYIATKSNQRMKIVPVHKL